ncbi:MAG: hypothetical protein AAF065_03025 [Verrucomicrobiota bacterium]
MIQFSGASFAKMPACHWLVAQLFSFTLLLASANLSAQSGGELFRGTWQIETPSEGAQIIILKNQGLASYFWGDNSDRTVYSGSWTNTNSAATVAWEDGRSHVIERTNSGFRAILKDGSGTNIYNAQAVQLPSEILGQWAKPPTRDEEMRSDRDEAKGFFGIWKIDDEDTFIFVEADRSAASTLASIERGQRGEWAKQGSELHIIWDSGQYGILRETERGFTYQLIEPGSVIEDDTTEAKSVVRSIESKVPESWFADYQSERESNLGGLAFSSRKVARTFYRGNWIVKRAEDQFEQVSMARFGGLETSMDRSLSGQWALSGQDVFMRWDDGMRKILSPVGRGFVLYEYNPGRPLDGVPIRVLAAAPADSSKLADHMKSRKDVALQFQQMAEAAGINPSSQKKAGWGRTFTRWVWPFGGDDNIASTQQLLVEEFEPAEDPDPWWWPFWSEKPETEATDAPVAVEMIEVDAPEKAEEGPDQKEEPESADVPKSKKERSRTDWIWPF